MSQPEWETIYATDCELLQVDRTGLYAPELERAEEFTTAKNKTRFLLFRVTLEQLTMSPMQLALFSIRPTLGHIPLLVDGIDAQGVEHRPWFEDQMHNSGRFDVFCIPEKRSAYCPLCRQHISLHLSDAAESADMPADELRALFCSPDPRDLASAYDIIAGYHGWENFDSYPLTLTVKQLDKRWAQAAPQRVPLTLDQRVERLAHKAP